LFGPHDENRIELTKGRDVEIDGKPLAETAPEVSYRRRRVAANIFNSTYFTAT
jgi:hypothetical protein